MATAGDPTPHDDELIGRAARQVRAARDNAHRAGLATAPPAAIDAGDDSAAPGLRPDSFPGYAIVGEGRRGGQGVVYEAIQTATRRRVAIKVLHAWPPGATAGRLRFEREVQVLAHLRHPNIVTIHDSSEADGRCYYVMDFIDGQPLDQWLAGHAGRGRREPRDTLRLFTRICDALQNAHVRGVIHRDLKPNNVLVDEDGEPHVVDFGLAKLTVADGDAAGEMTATGQFVGSLPWSSPEQLADSPHRVDTRSDVYALGVMLYHALTGRFPYPLDVPMATVINNIRTLEPPPPSRAAPGLPADVDTLVLKCLHKDPLQRYQTAGELGRDIERFLQGQPLAARRDSTAYVLRRYARRYRWPLAAGTTLLALLVAGSVTTTLLWRQASTQRDAAAAARQHADLRFAQLRSLARTFIYDLDEQIRDLPGATPARLLITDTARAYLDTLAADRTADADLLQDTALAYRKVGEILGRPMHATLGRYDEALVVIGQAREMLARLVAEQPDNLGALRELAATELPLAEIFRVQGRPAEARTHGQRYLDLARQVARTTDLPRDRRELAMALLVAYDLGAAGDNPEQGLALATEAAELLDALPADGDYPQDLQRDRSVACSRVGDGHLQAGRATEALAWYRRSLAGDEARLAARPDSATARRDLTVSLLRTAEALLAVDGPAAAGPLAARAVTLRARMHQEDPENAQALRDLATACYLQGQILRATADAPATPAARRASLLAARAAWQRALDLWHEMRTGGTLRAGDQGAGDELQALISAADTDLAILEPADRPSENEDHPPP